MFYFQYCSAAYRAKVTGHHAWWASSQSKREWEMYTLLLHITLVKLGIFCTSFDAFVSICNINSIFSLING